MGGKLKGEMSHYGAKVFVNTRFRDNGLCRYGIHYPITNSLFHNYSEIAS